MQPAADACVFIVDDDASVHAALAWLLRSRHLPSESFDGAAAILRHLDAGTLIDQPCCVLLDVRMPGMSGLALFDELLRRGLGQRLPVIFLTGHADLPTAVDAVKRGAFDFCEKPVSDNAMVDRVFLAIAQSRTVLQEQSGRAVIERRLGELTERELAVMRLWWCTGCRTSVLPIGCISACAQSKCTGPGCSTRCRSSRQWSWPICCSGVSRCRTCREARPAVRATRRFSGQRTSSTKRSGSGSPVQQMLQAKSEP